MASSFMMASGVLLLFSLSSFFILSFGQVSQYNVVWNTPSNDSRGSMPIGNGDIGLNVWVQSDALYFYIGKSDSWDQYSRLLKVGKVKITLSPNPFTSSNFQQLLDLQSGIIIVTAGETTIQLWVDANNPAIYVDIVSSNNLTATAETVIWRTEKRVMNTSESSGAHGICVTPYDIPDTVDTSDNNNNNVVWYHRNDDPATAWREALEIQGLSDFMQTQTDPLYNLTSGALLTSPNMKKISPTTLQGTGSTVYNISVVVLTETTESGEDYINDLSSLADSLSLSDPIAHSKYMLLHENWWAELWSQSFVYTNNETQYEVGLMFTLQRWQDACGGGRGKYPIKFNGLLFTTDYYFNNTFTYSADYRAWGGGYWFQNTRFPFWAMLANGDFDMMIPLFNMYLNAVPLSEARTQSWFNHPGSFFPETIFFWGTFLSVDYGCEYNKIPAWNVECTYMRYHLNGGLEVLALLLAHYAYTQDATVAQKYLIPLAETQMDFFNYHYQMDLNGQKCFTPAQAIETWQEVINPLPDIAGLNWTLTELLKLPFLTSAQNQSFYDLQQVLPEIPVATNGSIDFLVAAQSILDSSSHNVENPELYAIFPFPLYGVTKPEISTAVNAYYQRRFDCQVGWCQDVLNSALLGLTEETKNNIEARYKEQPGPGYRFPTFVGPYFDYQPEEDHTSVGQLAVQYMLLQTRGNAILLFPSWPAGWDVHFKLFTALQTTVEVKCEKGRITLLEVTPSYRRNDVQILGDSCFLL